MLSIFRRLVKNEKGATAIEYTLIASLIRRRRHRCHGQRRHQR